MVATLLILIAVYPASVASAHDGAPPEPHDIWYAWSWPAAVPLALAAFAYARGLRRLWWRAGPGRGVRRWQAGAYAGGLLALGVVLWAVSRALTGPAQEIDPAALVD